MQRVTPIEPFNPDPDARYLRESSRPGPVSEPRRRRGGRLLAVLAALLLIILVISGCAPAGAAQEPSASPADLKRAAASAWLCPGMHAEWLDAQTVACIRER